MIPIISELSSGLIIFGGYLSDEELDAYYSKYFDSMYRTGRILTSNHEYGFTAKVPFGIFSKYYVNDIGQIPRWSKWTKKLDKKWMGLE